MAKLLFIGICYRLFFTTVCCYAMYNMVVYFVADQMVQTSLSMPKNHFLQRTNSSNDVLEPTLVYTSSRTSKMTNNVIKQRSSENNSVSMTQANGQIQHIEKYRTLSQVNVTTQKRILNRDFIRFLELDKPGDSLIHTQNFTVSLHSDVCQKISPFALIFVHSAVKHRKQRRLIRATWGGVKSHRSLALATVFLVGLGSSGDQQMALETEAAQHGDLVQGPFLDTYRNLTYKHVMGLVWAWRHCPQATYVVKVDENTLVNPYVLLTFLKNVGVEDRVILCRGLTAAPFRREDNFRVTVEEYPFPKYPEYCEGFAYVLRRKTGKLLADAARTSKFFWVDDVFVTGLLRTKAGIRIKHFMPPFGFERNSRDVLKTRILTKLIIFFRNERKSSKTYLENWKRIHDFFAPMES